MMQFLKSHPFAVEAYFDSSVVLSFAVPKEQLIQLIPPCLELDLLKEQYGFIAVAMVQTRKLRPKGFPAFMGNDFFLIGYRIFVRYKTSEGKRLRGLYILRSETNKKKMEWLGSIFTQYKYHTIDIRLQREKDTQLIQSDSSGLLIKFRRVEQEIPLPIHSTFTDWKEARRFAGPLPFTFSYLEREKKVLIVEGVRSNWTPQPVQVLKPYQGVWNIVRFNWPFYVVAGMVILLVIGIAGYFSGLIFYFLLAAALAALIGMLVSLVVSHYIYDRSGIYDFDWLDRLDFPKAGSALTVNAGFDETTEILQHKLTSLQLAMADFYDPRLHTEPSIERARKIYPPKPEFQKINTAELPYGDQQFDIIFVLLSAHEIRNQKERVLFYSALKRVLRDGGKIIVMEHLRDLPNFLAYTIGFFHFHSHAAWIKCFELAELKLEREEKQTAFISLFILTKK